LKREEPAEDPELVGRRTELAVLAGKKLADARMIAFDQQNGTFGITDLGRIAARYYIRHASIETFNKHFRPRMTEADILAVISMSTEVHPDRRPCQSPLKKACSSTRYSSAIRKSRSLSSS
jgi:antiviral helicase SLH1